MRSDAPEFGFWKRLADAVPQTVKIAGVREAPAIMAEIAAELAARQQAGHDNSPPVYLLLYNLGRFRDLRQGGRFRLLQQRRPAGEPGQAVHRRSCAKARRWAFTPPSGATPTATSRGCWIGRACKISRCESSSR